jgi:hypothetical protein
MSEFARSACMRMGANPLIFKGKANKVMGVDPSWSVERFWGAGGRMEAQGRAAL